MLLPWAQEGNMGKLSVSVLCVACGHPFDAGLKAGEISIRLSVKGGRSMMLAGPVCSECAAKSASDPDVALDQMRAARTHLLLGGGQ